MSAELDLVVTLFSKEVLEKVRAQFQSGQEIVPSRDQSYRLFKAPAGNVNFEFPVFTQSFAYLQPVGVFTKDSKSGGQDLQVAVLQEFEEHVKTLAARKQIPSGVKVCSLSLEANGMIAACSCEARQHSKKLKDASFVSNGLACDMFTTTDGNLQVFLDDKYSVEGALAVYKMQENAIYPGYKHEDLFQRMYRMSLLTAYKCI